MEIKLITRQEAEDRLEFPMRPLALKVIRRALEREECPFDAEISLVFTDDDKIQKANREFRGIDASTDVLSFPAVDWEAPSDFEALDPEDPSYFDPESGRLILGDILLSLPHVRAQAASYGHSLQREFAFLLAHSTLHLCGYDHMTPAEEAEMTARQEAVLTSLGLTRDN